MPHIAAAVKCLVLNLHAVIVLLPALACSCNGAHVWMVEAKSRVVHRAAV